MARTSRCKVTSCPPGPSFSFASSIFSVILGARAEEKGQSPPTRENATNAHEAPHASVCTADWPTSGRRPQSRAHTIASNTNALCLVSSCFVSFRSGLFGAAGSTRGGLPVALAFTHSKASRRTLPRNSSAETAMSFALRSDHDPWAGKKREGALGRTRGRALPSAGGQLDVLGGLVWPSLFDPNSHVRVLDGEALLLRVILHELHGNLARRHVEEPHAEGGDEENASVSLRRRCVPLLKRGQEREREREVAEWAGGGLGLSPLP